MVFNVSLVKLQSILIKNLCLVLLLASAAVKNSLQQPKQLHQKLDLGPNANTGDFIKPRDFLDLESLFSPGRHYSERNVSIDRHLYDLEKGAEYVALYSLDSWQYSHDNQITRAHTSNASPEECRNQLEWLLDKFNDSITENNNKNNSDDWQKSVLTEVTEESNKLVQYLDSFGRVESDMYSGNIYWFGSYHHCLDVKLLNYDHYRQIGMRHCVGKVILKSWSDLYKYDNFRPKITIKIGICLPHDCHQRAALNGANLALVEQLMKINLAKMDQERFQLKDLYCLPDEQSQLRELSQQATLWLTFVILWLLLIVVATLMDNHSTNVPTKVPTADKSPKSQQLPVERDINNSGHKISHWTKMLSFHQNVRDFLAVDRGPASTDLTPVDCIRVTGTLFIVCSNTILVLSTYPNRVTDLNEDTQSILSLILTTSSQRIVDTMFIISGFLTGYHLLRRFGTDWHKLAQLSTWSQLQLMHYLRLSPTYLLVYYFTKHIFVALGSGPDWDYGTNDLSRMGSCQNEEWWRAILYFINGVGAQHSAASCSPTSWFLALDTQIYLTLSIFLFMFLKLRNSSYKMADKWLFGAIVTLASADTIKSLLEQEVLIRPENAFHVSHLFSHGLLAIKYCSQLQMGFVMRAGLVIVGLYAGQVVCLYEKSLPSTGSCDSGRQSTKQKNTEINSQALWLDFWPCYITNTRVFTATIVMGAVLFLMPTICIYFNQWLAWRITSNVALFLASCITIGWNVCQTIVIVRLVTKAKSVAATKDNIVVANYWHILYWPGWTILARLTYVIYLIHVDVIYFSLMKLGANSDTLADLNSFNMFKLNTFVIWWTVLVACFVHIVFELPTRKLLKRMSLRISNYL